MAETTMTGVFVAIEGLDGSGGTTQVQRLVGADLGWRVTSSREPSDGPIGRLIRAQLAGGEVGDSVLPYLFAADRRDHLDRTVLPAIARGELMVSDRYALSSFAYQAEALGLAAVMRLNQAFPAPTLTIMLDLSPAQCVDRIGRRGGTRDRFESLARLQRTEAAYNGAIDACRSLGWNICRFNADQPVDVLASEVADAVIALRR